MSCLQSELNLTTLGRLVARSPNLKTLRLNRDVPLEKLSNLLRRAPQLVDLGTGVCSAEIRSDTFSNLTEAFSTCKQLEGLSGLWDVVQAYLPANDSTGATTPQAERRKWILTLYMLVDYACTPEEVQQHFQSCGTVNRVTILTDKFGQPKGFAYVEFVEIEAVQNAVLLNESELHGRQLKVSAKRTNVPGMKQYRGRRPNPYFGSRRPFFPGFPAYPTYGFGRVPRFRRPMRYRPY